MKGSLLEGCVYRHPLFERTSPLVIGGDYITTETGEYMFVCVHIWVMHSDTQIAPRHKSTTLFQLTWCFFLSTRDINSVWLMG